MGLFAATVGAQGPPSGDETEKSPRAELEALLAQIENGELQDLTQVRDLLDGQANGGSTRSVDVTRPNSEIRAQLEANLEAAGVELVGRAPARRAPAGRAPLKASPVALYDNFGWAGNSGPVTEGSSSPDVKVLEILEQGTTNVFEADFQRVWPGTPITNLPITLNSNGESYYLLHDLTNTTVNGDGIIIDANDITINLNGYSLYGGNISGIASDDGIVVLGSQTNIKIFNGSVVGWDGDGINALNADFSIFYDLRVSQSDGDGLVTDFNCLIDRCTAFSNGLDGLEGDDGTVIHNSTAGQNGDNGIQASEGCAIMKCASFDNRTDGFDIAAGGVIRNCTASDNFVFGFDVALGSQAYECTAYDNVSNGFDMASACILRDCISSLNSGHGVRTFANSYLTDNKFHENDLDGIRISSTDCFVAHNQTTDNDHTGINNTASGSLIIANTCSGNVTNYNIDPNTAFGPILDVTNAGDLSGVAGAEHPWANFAY